MRLRFTIPTPGSPAYVLAGTSVLLGIIGIPLLIIGLKGLIDGKSNQTDSFLILATGVLLIAIAIPTAISGFKKTEPPQSLLSSDMTPLERISQTLDQVEIELANKEIAEASRIALQLAPSDEELLKTIRTTALSAPSHDDVVRTLAARSSANIQLANPALQPIAFALKPTTAWNYVKGISLEALTWGLVILATPLIIVSDVWTTGRIVLHRALRLRRLARQYRGRSLKLLRHDERMPVLYLRSFSHDHRESSETLLPTTSEEKLVRSYNRVGPVIALGNPRERLPILGASRLYFEDESIWQPAVLYLMSISQLIVIQAGNAPGLLQELGFVRCRLDPSRIIMSFSAWEDLDEWTRQLQYLRFKKFAEVLLECKLPEDIRATSSLTFDESWKPQSHSDPSYALPSVRKRRARLKRVAVNVLPIVGIVWAVYIAPRAVPRIINATGVNKYTETNPRWNKHLLGSTGMSVQLPGDPANDDEKVWGMGLEEYRTFIYHSGDLTSKMRYSRHSELFRVVNDSDLRDFADGLCGVGTFTDLTKQQRGFGTSSWDGKCLRDGKEYKLGGYRFAIGQKVWMILALFDSDNNAANAAAEKILNSASIAGFGSYKKDAAEWMPYSLGSAGMTVALPHEPTTVGRTPLVFGLQEISTSVYNGGDLLALVQYAKSIGDASFDETGLGKIAASLCGTDAVSDLTTQQVADSRLGLDGKCSRNGEEYKLQGYCFIKDQHFGLILALYGSSDKAAILAVDRMINSLKTAEQKLAK